MINCYNYQPNPPTIALPSNGAGAMTVTYNNFALVPGGTGSVVDQSPPQNQSTGADLIGLPGPGLFQFDPGTFTADTLNGDVAIVTGVTDGEYADVAAGIWLAVLDTQTAQLVMTPQEALPTVGNIPLRVTIGRPYLTVTAQARCILNVTGLDSNDDPLALGAALGLSINVWTRSAGGAWALATTISTVESGVDIDLSGLNDCDMCFQATNLAALFAAGGEGFRLSAQTRLVS